MYILQAPSDHKEWDEWHKHVYTVLFFSIRKCMIEIAISMSYNPLRATDSRLHLTSARPL